MYIIDHLTCRFQSIELDTSQVQAYIGRGLANGNLGKHDQAISDFTKAIELDPIQTVPYMNRSLSYIEKKNNVAAIKDLSKVLEMQPESYEALSLRAFTYINANHTSEAVADLTKLITHPSEKNVVSRYHQRAMQFLKLGKQTAALSDLDSALQAAGETQAACLPLNTKAWIHCWYKSPEEAIKCANRAIRINPRFASAFDSRGYAYLLQRKYDEAINDFSKALELSHDANVEALTHRGKTFMKSGKMKEALQDFNKAEQINASYCHLYYQRAKYYQLNKDDEHAIQDLTQYIKLKPVGFDPEYKESSAYYKRGLSHQAKEMKIEATTDLLAAVKMGPKNSKYEKSIIDLIATDNKT